MLAIALPAKARVGEAFHDPRPVIAQMPNQSTEPQHLAPLAGEPATDRMPFVQPAVQDLGGLTEKTQQLGGSGA
jgi:hypothetical protein